MALSLLLLAAVSADPADVPDVRALLVTHLKFEEQDREQVGAAAAAVLASCSSSCPSTGEDFEGVFRQCHLYVKFPSPREVTVRGSQKVKVDAMVISFPTNTGGVWVRSGKDYAYYTKFDYKACQALHEAMKAGKPE